MVVYGTMGRLREVWGGVWDDKKGAGGMGWCMGRTRDKVVYEVMGRAHERRGGV